MNPTLDIQSLSGARSEICAETFSEIYDKYSPALYGVIHKILKTVPLTEDALQNTFIKIWLHKESYDMAKSRQFTWMLNIARNEAIDVLRSKSYRNSRATVGFDDCHLMPTESLLLSLDRIDIRKHLSFLNLKDRTILELCFFRGFTCEETSKILNMPCGSVKTRMQHSYKQLKLTMV